MIQKQVHLHKILMEWNMKIDVDTFMREVRINMKNPETGYDETALMYIPEEEFMDPALTNLVRGYNVANNIEQEVMLANVAAEI